MKKILKLMYLIDEKSIRNLCRPITWLDYYVWEHGPVSPVIYNLKQDNSIFQSYVSITKNVEDAKWIFRPNMNIDIETAILVFSKKELSLINEIIYSYKKSTAEELSTLTHEEGSLWSTTCYRENVAHFKDGKTEIQLNLSNLLEDKNDVETYEEAKDMIYFRAQNN